MGVLLMLMTIGGLVVAGILLIASLITKRRGWRSSRSAELFFGSCFTW